MLQLVISMGLYIPFVSCYFSYLYLQVVFWAITVVMGLPQARWLVYFMKHPNKKTTLDDTCGYPADLGNFHMVCL